MDEDASPPATASETATEMDGKAAPEHEAEEERTPDPQYLVAQLSDLPARFSLVPGETFHTRLASVLADPWSARYAALVRRERVAGYQTSFWSPERRRIECTAAVYRSTDGARQVFRVLNRHFGAFLAAWENGRPARVEEVGQESNAYRFELGRSKGLTVVWRYRNVLASCTTVGVGPADVTHVMGVVTAQQARISKALG